MNTDRHSGHFSRTVAAPCTSITRMTPIPAPGIRPLAAWRAVEVAAEHERRFQHPPVGVFLLEPFVTPKVVIAFIHFAGPFFSRGRGNRSPQSEFRFRDQLFHDRCFADAARPRNNNQRGGQLEY